MKKTLIALLFSPLLSLGQSGEAKYENDTLHTKSGYTVAPKQKLKIGTGSMNDGDFKFIRTSSTSLLQYSSNSGYNGLANQANSFSRSNAGLEYEVLRIDKRGNKRNGYVYYPIVSQGLKRFEIDIENAIAAGEVVVPEEFAPKKNNGVTVKQELSLADELVKLKKLHDDGILTKEEYDTAKKKLLDKQ